MLQGDHSLRMPYGAYELKATYQRNMLTALLATLTFATAMLAAGWLLIGDRAPADKRPRVLDGGKLWSVPPPIVRPQAPEVTGSGQPTVENHSGGIPEPVVDELAPDPAIMNTAERAAVVDSYGDSGRRGSGGEGGSGNVGAIYDEPLPPIDSFILVEEPPELIYSVLPEYPRWARESETEGRVIIKALISKEGDVLDAVVFVSSENTLLDEAALAVARKYKYRPAIQNGRPIAVWVTYKVDFKLDR